MSGEASRIEILDLGAAGLSESVDAEVAGVVAVGAGAELAVDALGSAEGGTLIGHGSSLSRQRCAGGT